MFSFPLMMSLLDPLYWLFSKIMSFLYSWTGDYGLTIIAFTFLARALMIPLFAKSQKGMLKQQALMDDVNEIKRRYSKNMQEQSRLTQELYRENGVSTGMGCLTAILPLLLIFPMFTILRYPMLYIVGVSQDNINKITEFLTNHHMLTERAISQLRSSDIPLLYTLKENGAALTQVVQNGWLRLDQLIDLDFLGLNLGSIPSWRPSDLFGANSLYYWYQLLLPALVLITSFWQMHLTKKSMPNRMLSKAEKDREKKNPAKAGQTPADQGAGMMKTMNFMMPVLMLVTMFSVPSALGLHYLIGNLLFVVQTLIIYHYYTKPFRQFTNQTIDKRKKHI